ncbi:MAG: response regulator transcription factor [Tenericutes bacterium]|nr:response regulator transcription factor [Mycoplasmatota bacterium]
MAKILVVEDNTIINKTISRMLQSYGYKVDSAFDAEKALLLFNSNQYDLIILDLHLPKMSGYTFLQVIRKKSEVPVIINTAYASTKSRVNLIKVGADDFIEKSMDKNEIVESVKLLLDIKEKQEELKKKTLEVYDLVIDFKNRSLVKKMKSIELTSKEFDILKLLFDNPRTAFSRKQLYMIIWGEEYSPIYDNTINVHMKRLRTKIEKDPKKPLIVETVFKHGYRLGKKTAEELENRLESQA